MKELLAKMIMLNVARLRKQRSKVFKVQGLNGLLTHDAKMYSQMDTALKLKGLR